MKLHKLIKKAVQGSGNPLNVIEPIRPPGPPIGGDRPNIFGNQTMFNKQLGKASGESIHEQQKAIQQLTQGKQPLTSLTRPFTIPMSNTTTLSRFSKASWLLSKIASDPLLNTTPSMAAAPPSTRSVVSVPPSRGLHTTASTLATPPPARGPITTPSMAAAGYTQRPPMSRPVAAPLLRNTGGAGPLASNNASNAPTSKLTNEGWLEQYGHKPMFGYTPPPSADDLVEGTPSHIAPFAQRYGGGVGFPADPDHPMHSLFGTTPNKSPVSSSDTFSTLLYGNNRPDIPGITIKSNAVRNKRAYTDPYETPSAYNPLGIGQIPRIDPYETPSAYNPEGIGQIPTHPSAFPSISPQGAAGMLPGGQAMLGLGKHMHAHPGGSTPPPVDTANVSSPEGGILNNIANLSLPHMLAAGGGLGLAGLGLGKTLGHAFGSDEDEEAEARRRRLGLAPSRGFIGDMMASKWFGPAAMLGGGLAGLYGLGGGDISRPLSSEFWTGR